MSLFLFCICHSDAVPHLSSRGKQHAVLQEVLVSVKWNQSIFHPILIRKLALKQILLEQLSACVYNI